MSSKIVFVVFCLVNGCGITNYLVFIRQVNCNSNLIFRREIAKFYFKSCGIAPKYPWNFRFDRMDHVNDLLQQMMLCWECWSLCKMLCNINNCIDLWFASMQNRKLKNFFTILRNTNTVVFFPVISNLK